MKYCLPTYKPNWVCRLVPCTDRYRKIYWTFRAENSLFCSNLMSDDVLQRSFLRTRLIHLLKMNFLNPKRFPFTSKTSCFEIFGETSTQRSMWNTSGYSSDSIAPWKFQPKQTSSQPTSTTLPLFDQTCSSQPFKSKQYKRNSQRGF